MDQRPRLKTVPLTQRHSGFLHDYKFMHQGKLIAQVQSLHRRMFWLTVAGRSPALPESCRRRAKVAEGP